MRLKTLDSWTSSSSVLSLFHYSYDHERGFFWWFWSFQLASARGWEINDVMTKPPTSTGILLLHNIERWCQNGCAQWTEKSDHLNLNKYIYKIASDFQSDHLEREEMKTENHTKVSKRHEKMLGLSCGEEIHSVFISNFFSAMTTCRSGIKWSREQ